MKKLRCFKNFTAVARFVFAYETEAKAALESSYKKLDATEKLPKFEDEQKSATEALARKQTEEMQKVENGHKAAKESEDKELSAMPQSTPKEKSDYAKKKKEFEGRQTARKDDLEKARKGFELAKTAALAALKVAYDEANAKRTKAAEAFSKSIANEIMTAQEKERDKNAGKDVEDFMFKSTLGFSPSVKMPKYGTVEGESGPQKLDGGPTWNGKSVRLATIEMLKAIYIEQGPEAAKAKAEELKKACREKDARGQVNEISWAKAFSGDDKGKGGFEYVLKTMQFNPARGAELFGMVVGNMSAAAVLFKDKPEIFARYEAAVQDAVKRGGAFPTPSAWARNNAPELFTQPGDPGKFTDKILEAYKLPAVPANYAEYKDGKRVARAGSSIAKEIAAYETALAKKATVRATLLGALSSAPSDQWDAVSRQILAKMMGGTFNADKINEADPEQVKAGRELYGDSGRRLDADSKAYISGLIYGADVAYGGRVIEVEVNGKKEKKDFATFYKEILNQSLKKKENLNSDIRDLQDEMRDEKEASRDKNNGKLTPEEKARIESEYSKKVYGLISKEMPKASDVWGAYEKAVAAQKPPVAPPTGPSTTPQPSPGGVPVAVTPPPKPKAGSGGGKAPSTGAGGGTSGGGAVATGPGRGVDVQGDTPRSRFNRLPKAVKDAMRKAGADFSSPEFDNDPAKAAAKAKAELGASADKVPPGEYMTPWGVRYKVEKKDNETTVSVTGLGSAQYNKTPEDKRRNIDKVDDSGNKAV